MTALPTINDILETAQVLPGRPQFWTSEQLAAFYQTTPARLMQQFRRNPDRFPADFWFELRSDEKQALVIQNASPSRANRGVLVGFTRAGSLALSGVLRTPVADAVSVTIIRAFTAMEQQAISDARSMLQKLRIDTTKKPIYHWCLEAAKFGWTFEQLFRSTNYTRKRLDASINELIAMGIMDQPLTGMQKTLFPAGQSDG